jgi:hypothetical protein
MGRVRSCATLCFRIGTNIPPDGQAIRFMARLPNRVVSFSPRVRCVAGIERATDA